MTDPAIAMESPDGTYQRGLVVRDEIFK